MMKANFEKHRFFSKLKRSKDELKEPYISKGLLGTEDRISEILTGIVMILTFTCTFSVIKSDSASIMDMLTGAICSTTAWGLFDAVLYLYMTLIDKEHNLTFINFVRKSKNTERVNQIIVDALPSAISALMQPSEIEALRGKIQKLPEPEKIHRLKFDDYRSAAGIFLLVFFATIPISIPFVLIKDIKIALRVSNIIAILMMFFCGYALGKYVCRNRIVTGIITSLIGIGLVTITIALGG
jgi:VIT1/CCC1 family predicted Fe2+/Mn2+ transporter